jgi:hypothetical protein
LQSLAPVHFSSHCACVLPEPHSCVADIVWVVVEHTLTVEMGLYVATYTVGGAVGASVGGKGLFIATLDPPPQTQHAMPASSPMFA